MKNSVIICIFFIQILCLNAQVQPNIVTEIFEMNSDFLKGKRTIQVHLPDSYSKSENKLPVLYVLDGEVYFPLSISVSNMLHQFNSSYVPNFIIVSIAKTGAFRERYGLYNDDDLKFADFLEKELIPNIESKYRTSERYLFGWQYAGSFAVRSMIYKPQLFDSYFVADPYPLMPKFDTVFKAFYKRLNEVKQLKSNLYLTYGFQGGTVKEGAEFLNTRLKKLKIKGLTFSIKELRDEQHRSTPFNSIYSGLRNYHHNYTQLQIRTLEEFKSNGGLSYVKDYYKKRSLRYGFPEELGRWTKFTLIRTAIREDNFEMFESLMNELSFSNDIVDLRLSRAASIARFYNKHSKPDIALSIYLELYKKHSTSIGLNKAISELYKSKNEKSLASEYANKAKALESKNQH